MSPCPICALAGGFHDRATHNAHVVPVEALTAGDRFDAHLIAEARRSSFVADLFFDVWDKALDEVVVGSGRHAPSGILSALSGGELG